MGCQHSERRFLGWNADLTCNSLLDSGAFCSLRFISTTSRSVTPTRCAISFTDRDAARRSDGWEELSQRIIWIHLHDIRRLVPGGPARWYKAKEPPYDVNRSQRPMPLLECLRSGTNGGARWSCRLTNGAGSWPVRRPKSASTSRWAKPASHA